MTGQMPGPGLAALFPLRVCDLLGNSSLGFSGEQCQSKGGPEQELGARWGGLPLLPKPQAVFNLLPLRSEWEEARALQEWNLGFLQLLKPVKGTCLPSAGPQGWGA